ncbi:MAG: hypothetical protein QXJ59_05400, partial [Thermofilaceae archaeon]
RIPAPVRLSEQQAAPLRLDTPASPPTGGAHTIRKAISCGALRRVRVLKRSRETSGTRCERFADEAQLSARAGKR